MGSRDQSWASFAPPEIPDRKGRWSLGLRGETMSKTLTPTALEASDKKTQSFIKTALMGPGDGPDPQGNQSRLFMPNNEYQYTAIPIKYRRGGISRYGLPYCLSWRWGAFNRSTSLMRCLCGLGEIKDIKHLIKETGRDHSKSLACIVTSIFLLIQSYCYASPRPSLS